MRLDARGTRGLPRVPRGVPDQKALAAFDGERTPGAPGFVVR